MRNKKEISLFIGSPSDTENERRSVEEIVSELNDSGLGEMLEIILKTKTWEKDTYSSVGNRPQEVINNQIGEYDIFIGIMWKKFGNPTHAAGSATEEEFDRAYEAYKQGGCREIMFFFNTDALPQTDLNTDQFNKVQLFKKKIGTANPAVYYRDYALVEFKDIFRSQITKYLTNIFKKDKESIEKIESTIPSNLSVQISEEMSTHLSDIEIEFTHPAVDKIYFDDIYVPHNIRCTKNINVGYKHMSITKLTEALNFSINKDGINIEDDIKYLILGDEISGKTALCKYIFKRYFDLNKIPILLSGEDISSNIRKDKIIEIITHKLQNQYTNVNKYIQKTVKGNDEFIVIIDDFHKSAKGKDKHIPTLMSNLEGLFSNIIIVSNNKISTNDLTASPPFKNFEKYIIMEFGPILRSLLIAKWCSLGKNVYMEDPNDLYRKNDDSDNQVKSILGKNYISSYPFYILGILQALENTKTININYSIHGFYYEMLINKLFEKYVDKSKDISFYYNFMTSFCYYLFEKKTKQATIGDFDGFFHNYCIKYDIDIKSFSLNKVKSIFYDSGLIHFNTSAKIDKNYIYYFFIAKYIANNIEEDIIKEVIKKLNKRLFREQYASIIMFVTHLSKNKWIIQNLLDNANEIFKDITPLHLEHDISEINNLISKLPQQVVEHIDINKERSEKIQIEDRLEEAQKEFDDDEINYEHFSLDDDLSSIDFMAKMNLALKTIDILGQVAKKYWGELDSETKYNLAQTTYNLGLRSLGLYFGLIKDNHKEIVEYISTLIIEKHIEKSTKKWEASQHKDTVEQTTNNVIIGLCYLSSWAIIKRVSNSIGYDKLNLTFDKVLEANPHNSYKLIDFSIKLNQSGVPMKCVEEYCKVMSNNKMCFKLLQDLVIDHMYMFDVSYEKKAQIQEYLKIDIKRQLYIHGSSQVKK